MAQTTLPDLSAQLETLDPTHPDRASRTVDVILNHAVARLVSDIHFEPTYRAMEVRYRIDGVLQSVASLSRELAPNLIARLKVLAELLTYRLDIPQEGRIASSSNSFGVEMRVSTFPTIHGERVVVRLFDPLGRMMDLEQLGLSPEDLRALERLLQERTGALLFTGPSGSGKTTTIYASLRHLVRSSGRGRHIVSIEDPVEQVIEGVSQSQVHAGSEFDFARGLRSLLRQDPEVIMVGEIRDQETAKTAIEAALTGHLVISTLHAGSSCGVIGRLLEMGIEPYLLTSALKGIMNQRLVRRLCPACRSVRGPEAVVDPGAELESRGPPHCPECLGTGYRGRLLLAELLVLDDGLRRAIVAKSDTNTLETIAAPTLRRDIRAAADQAVYAGLTSSQEIDRVLGHRMT